MGSLTIAASDFIDICEPGPQDEKQEKAPIAHSVKRIERGESSAIARLTSGIVCRLSSSPPTKYR
nr:hypothetical protein [Pectobacterium brasiliense]